MVFLHLPFGSLPVPISRYLAGLFDHAVACSLGRPKYKSIGIDDVFMRKNCISVMAALHAGRAIADSVTPRRQRNRVSGASSPFHKRQIIDRDIDKEGRFHNLFPYIIDWRRSGENIDSEADFTSV